MVIDTEWMNRWVEAINLDEACQYNGRKFCGAITFLVGEDRYVFHVYQGRIDKLVDGATILEPSAFTLSAKPEVWERLFAANPEPMYQAFFAAIGMGHMQIEGDLRPMFQQMTTLSEWLRVATRCMPSAAARSRRLISRSGGWARKDGRPSIRGRIAWLLPVTHCWSAAPGASLH